ncbi:hypothetical protein M9H77_25335 [Catharanthus roseus]|uniref:Uncharacterized protein n=1 Tax=Catharanthus roseus TaxID=4058 RepID=A0ACC0A7V8_CATRO|nr:hypothetical protein M9H77_25335 [Catharanthus roseus]
MALLRGWMILDNVDPTAAAAAAAAAEGGEGTIVKCSLNAVARLSPNLKSQYASAQMSPIQPLRLLVSNNYPNCPLILLDKFPVEKGSAEPPPAVAEKVISVSMSDCLPPMTELSEPACEDVGGLPGVVVWAWSRCRHRSPRSPQQDEQRSGTSRVLGSAPATSGWTAAATVQKENFSAPDFGGLTASDSSDFAAPKSGAQSGVATAAVGSTSSVVIPGLSPEQWNSFFNFC